MGANPTQAYGVITFLAAFVLIAAACATGNIFLVIIGLAGLALSVFVFRKCKPWEHEEP